mmetsp:Transcript_44612/g.95886  ORF Transcript_44612/g.95886 Transcript_44612/m.95886 type:complete len:358 (-) Transcript_44612:72-1145(-)
MAPPSAWNSQTFLEVLRLYSVHANKEVARVKRNLFGLSDDDKGELTWKGEEQVQAMEDAVKVNIELLDKLGALLKEGPPKGLDERTHIDAPQGSKPAQVLLQTFTREWSAEGLKERGECHDLLVSALDAHFKDKKDEAGSKLKIAVPGASLGRLAFDIAQRGYDCTACEGRVLQWYGSELIRRTAGEKEALKLQPFVLSTCNRFKRLDHIRETPVPEVEVKEGQLPPVVFGDFLKVFGTSESRASYDGLATAFTVDCSPNILRFVRTAAHIVRPGGVWVNFGPLAYDTEHDEGHGHGVELSWEELRYAISHFFDVTEEKFVDSLQASNWESMMQIQYSCIYFRAVRNSTESTGIGAR